MTIQQHNAAASGTYAIGGELTVNRLGYGTMQLTGPGVWGDPKDPDEAIRVLQRTAELGVNFIDTADSYGPFTADLLLRKALHPYNEDLVIATKAGLSRSGPNDWRPLGRPEYLRQQAELNLRHLGLERIDLFQLHRIDPKVPLAEQLGELALLQQEGKIRHIGLSQVSVAELIAASEIAKIASVQNLYNLSDRKSEDVLNYAEAHDIAFIPWFPLATGALAKEGGPLDAIAKKYEAKPSQIALAWLLKRSKVMLPIPGTSSVAHVEENIAAAGISLSDEDFAELSALAK
ncbi:aldo/keto reductase [Paenibacillus sacheonensis]|uniref:Oxidoreductase n=1 Tax=Paenibacillus sacheonensis TaxID=742054 RepID=A0A7X5C1J6_9BACL|nr:aldo/keto reductase [Paenibacillus sacheonensis]MBM7567280.1 aryl-alcohol dehydrogenase-like predicted oxidoreductase [Paenibacillus sacheonensis]NBC72827.1 oxidoreductase [Paenibacillus sacheonensis]